MNYKPFIQQAAARVYPPTQSSTNVRFCSAWGTQMQSTKYSSADKDIPAIKQN